MGKDLHLKKLANILINSHFTTASYQRHKRSKLLKKACKANSQANRANSSVKVGNYESYKVHVTKNYKYQPFSFIIIS